MYATIRRYSPKGVVPSNAMEELRRLLHDEFLPIARGIQGFHGYYAVNVEGRELVTLSIFETPAGGEESTRRAADFVKQHTLPFELGRPEVLSGEVLTFAEAAREVGAH
jgi:hypothetical protein